VQGYANENLGSLSYDVSNAAALLTDQAGVLTGRFYDTNSLAITNYYFQLYDVSLTNGLNTVTIHATDLSGNVTTTNFSIALDYSSNTNPPVLNIIWPQNGASICGTNFTLHAHVDDALDYVTAAIVDSGGDTNTVAVSAQRNGNVWASGLPLAAGTNILTVTAVNPAGNSVTTNLTLVQSAVTVTMDALPDYELNWSSVYVTGEISSTNYSLTVNGVQATINADGTWSADSVPVSGVGMAVFDLEVYEGDPVNVGSQQTIFLQPPTITISSLYDFEYDFVVAEGASGFCTTIDRTTTYWTKGIGGADQFSGYDSCGPSSSIFDPIDPDTYSDNNGLGDWYFGGFDATYSASASTEHETESYGTTVQLNTGGEGQEGTMRTYLLLAEAADYPSHEPLPLGALSIGGQSLQDSGTTDDYGSDWGVTFLRRPAGTMNEDVSVSAVSSDYDFYAHAAELSLIVVSNSATQIGTTTNWATVKAQSNYVYVQLSVTGGGDAVMAYVTNHISWSGGESVLGNPLQRIVSTAASTNTVVTATVGSTSQSLQMWVIWATVTVADSGSKTSYDPSTDTGDSANFPIFAGDDELGPENLLANTSPYLGFKVEIKGTLSPLGVHQVITTGWAFYQTLTYIDFLNNTNFSTDSGTDAPDKKFNSYGSDYEDKTPDRNENIFVLDGPGYNDSFATYKSTDNFQTWVRWNGQTASDPAQWWVRQKAEYSGSNYNVTTNTGGLGTTTIDTSY
jgi:hypothetical protein